MDKIDFIITWVDGNDPAWRQERDRYLVPDSEERKEDGCRFRDWETLKYWFRGVERFAPWVNNIFFVTWGHLPAWLDTSHPKLKIVRHEDYIPTQYLPTFNSNVIEYYFHRIKGLSEQFVYFNDDHVLLDGIKPERFFRNGLPCDTGGFFNYNRKGEFGASVYLAVQLINSHFDKWKTFSGAFCKWVNPAYPYWSFRNLLDFGVKKREFCGFFDHHLPQGFLKSTYDEVWKHCAEDLTRTSKNRFRQYGDVAFWLLRYWQLASDSFSPCNVYKDGGYYSIKEQNIQEITDCIRQQRKSLLCLNDTVDTTDFLQLKKEILAALEAVLPRKSGFEK